VDNFDEYAMNYRQIHNENLSITGLSSDYFAVNKIKIISYHNKEDRNYKILDVGCGDGKLEEYIPMYFCNYNAYGIDISKESINRAREKGIAGCVFDYYDGSKIPFEENFFDIVILSTVLHHVNREDHLNLINEVYRVMKPGSKLFIFEHNPVNPFTNYIVKTCVFDKGVTLLSHYYCKKILRKVHFDKIEINFTSFFPNKYFFKYLVKYEDLFKKVPFGGQYYVIAEKKQF
jgi:ubiquinone/menaquinone biosynthesis C-methylase UbiE